MILFSNGKRTPRANEHIVRLSTDTGVRVLTQGQSLGVVIQGSFTNSISVYECHLQRRRRKGTDLCLHLCRL